ncbi:MAG TPA: hypothetical protein VGO50_14050 [Pyrinomonadaceae bacterium]|jgi:CheY-like chemotaxis protein|nr:hypothetical protein [Pyrinomonadaceae bacterium]
MKILLVENDIRMRRLMKSMLAEIAGEIYESDGGPEAIELYRSERPDWVVMDVYRKPANG